MSLREQVEGRLKAAQINGGAAAAEPRGNGRYVVTGRDGHTRYTVHVLSAENAACDCPAFVKGGGRFCWHAAAALLRNLADSQAMVA